MAKIVSRKVEWKCVGSYTRASGNIYMGISTQLPSLPMMAVAAHHSTQCALARRGARVRRLLPLSSSAAVGTTTFATDESLIPPKCPPIFAKGNTKCRYDTTSTLAATYTMYWEYNNNSHYVEIKKTQFGLLVVN